MSLSILEEKIKCKCGFDMRLDSDKQSYVCKAYPFCTYRIYIKSIPEENICYRCGKKFVPKNSSDTHCLKCKEELRKLCYSNSEHLLVRRTVENHPSRYIEGKCKGVFGDGLNKEGEKCGAIINIFFGKEKCVDCRNEYHKISKKNRRVKNEQQSIC